jgi:hypothetical protein
MAAEIQRIALLNREATSQASGLSGEQALFRKRGAP